MFKPKKLYIILSILICSILASCMYVYKIKTKISHYNSKAEVTKYDPLDVPSYLVDILSKQTYPAIYVEKLAKNTYLLHDSRSSGFLNIKTSAKLRNKTLHIKIRKRRTVDETSDNHLVNLLLL